MDEIEEKRIIELQEEKERAFWEKRTLENDLTLLHKNLDVETRFNREMVLENTWIQD